MAVLLMDLRSPLMDLMSRLPGLQELAAHRTSTSLFLLMLEPFWKRYSSG